MTKIRETQNHT